MHYIIRALALLATMLAAQINKQPTAATALTQLTALLPEIFGDDWPYHEHLLRDADYGELALALQFKAEELLEGEVPAKPARKKESEPP